MKEFNEFNELEWKKTEVREMGSERSYRLREEWLAAIGRELEPIFAEKGYSPAPSYKISCGFTSKGVRGKAIGECFHTKCSTIKVNEIFIHPKLAEPLEVAAVVAHEMAHSYVGIEAKHGPRFKECATKMGLTGKMTATVPGPTFKELIGPILERVGPYPHGALEGKGTTGPKQPTRLLKVECLGCGYCFRITQKWVEVGLPKCPNPDCDKQGEELEVK